MDRTDQVVQTLDAHVRSGRLSPEQASRLYDDLLPASRVAEPEQHDRATALVTGVLTLAVGVALAGVSVAVAGRSAYEPWEGFSIKTALTTVGTLAVTLAAVAVLVLRGRAAHRQAAGVLLASAGWILSMALLDMADAESMTYVSGGLLLIGGVCGYLWLRRPVVSLVAVFGAVQLCGRIASDVSLDSSDSSGDVLLWGIVGAAFGVAVVAVGWRTSAHRMLFVAGATIAYASLALVAVTLGVAGAFVGALGGLGSDSYDGTGSSDGMHTDATLACVFGLLLTVAALVVYVVRRHNHALVMTWIGAVVFPALLVAARGFRHPVVWGAVLAFVAALLVAGALVVVERARRQSSPPARFDRVQSAR